MEGSFRPVLEVLAFLGCRIFEWDIIKYAQLYGKNSLMFNVKYLYHFRQWITAMEPDDERCLNLLKSSKDIATEIHAHFNCMFQQHDCFLSGDIWCAASSKNKMVLANLERIWNISSLAIENANPWCQLRTARLELYLPGNYIPREI